MTRKTLPRFVVLGQGKSGTSLIYRILSQHPSIGLSHPKELHYFNRDFDTKPLADYAAHFANQKDKDIIGEVSPSYLDPQPVERIAQTLGRDTKVIFVLRRPIERGYSRYLQNICAREAGTSFQSHVPSMSRLLSQIGSAITRCYDFFGRENVLPLFYETDIATSDPVFVAKILDFLGLPDTGHAKRILEKKPVNAGVMPRYVYAGGAPAEFHSLGKKFRIPANTLVFCAQRRNSRVYEGASADDVAAALARQSSWTTAITETEYARWQKRHVLPCADRFEAEFGFDLSHWRCAPRRISYDAAPPPRMFRA